MIQIFSLNTARQGFTNITAQVEQAAAAFYKETEKKEAVCTIFCLHTTAGITINENADPDVVHDILFALDKTFPNRPEFMHAEGNSAAHLKASFTGSNAQVIVQEGKLLLGTWQGIYFCEFDGPRTRQYCIQIQ